MELILRDGSKRTVEMSYFPALEGWNIQRDYVKFRHTDDNEFRTQFTMRVLSYCKVMNRDQSFPMTTDAIIDNHLGSWENIKKVFDAILLMNGINPDAHAEQPLYWEKVGSAIAIEFLAQCENLIGPALRRHEV